MTAKEYLCQAYRLDQQIKSDLEEAAALRKMVACISSMPLGERVQSSCKGDPVFVRNLEKILELESEIGQEIIRLVNLKKEIHLIISALEDVNERMVLKYRYIHNYTWEQIARAMGMDRRTVQRWHEKGVQHIVLENNV